MELVMCTVDVLIIIYFTLLVMNYIIVYIYDLMIYEYNVE